jgi:hypothetical protein
VPELLNDRKNNAGMKIYVSRPISAEALINTEIVDDGTDKVLIRQQVLVITLPRKLSQKEAEELDKALKKQDLQIIRDKNGKVKYYD